MNSKIQKHLQNLLKQSKNPLIDIENGDPQWLDMFLTVFIERSSTPTTQTTTLTANTTEKIEDYSKVEFDDLLFFVKLQLDSDGESAVLVKRKIGSKLPELEDLIDWKETFFLNLIAQLHFEMTVSVCEKRRLGPLIGTGNESASTFSSADSDDSRGYKKSLFSLKSISKRVYASPHKSRMDKKTLGSQISYPTIYFSIEDFEDAFDGMIVQNDQYLCVELSIPASQKQNQHSLFERILLFQGAVPFDALYDTYQAKQQSAGPLKFLQRFSKSIQYTLTGTEPKGRFGADDDDETQYVMMRGPNGKGHAQVAIKPATFAQKSLQHKSEISLTSSTFSIPSNTSNNDVHLSSPPTRLYTSQMAQSEQGQISENIDQVGNVPPIVQSMRRLSSHVQNSIKLAPSKQEEEKVPLEIGLACFMTYIHLPWHSIISDMFSNFKSSKSEDSNVKTVNS